MIKTRMTISDKGQTADAFRSEGFVVLFNDTAPVAVKDFCFIIDRHELNMNIMTGDYLVINDQKFRIMRVGDFVNENYANLGHITLQFNDSYLNQDIMGGSIYLDQPITRDIDIGDILEIISGD